MAVACVEVLENIKTARSYRRCEDLEREDLMPPEMRPIVQHQVEWAERREALQVFLI